MDMYAVGMMAMNLIYSVIKEQPCEMDYKGCFFATKPFHIMASKIELMTTPHYFNIALGDADTSFVGDDVLINFLECIFWVRPKPKDLLNHKFFSIVGHIPPSGEVPGCEDPKPKTRAEACGGECPPCPKGQCDCPPGTKDPKGNPLPEGSKSARRNCEGPFGKSGSPRWCAERRGRSEM